MKLYERFKNSYFLKNVFLLSSGMLIRQIILFACIPIISRLFMPAEIGDFAVITSISSIMSGFMTLGLMMAIMFPDEDGQSQAICTVLLYSISFFTTIFCGGMLLFRDVVRLMNVHMYYPLACFCLWLYAIANAVNSIVYGYANRKKLYKIMFLTPILGAVVSITGVIIAGVLRLGAFGYSMGNICGCIAGIVYMMFYVNPFHFTSVSIRGTLRDNLLFVKYQWPANIIDFLTAQIPVQMLSWTFGSSAVGNYAMCSRVFQAPLTLLSSSISRVYFREATERLGNDKPIGEFTFKILKGGIRIAIIPVIILMIFGEPLFAFVFGQHWREAGLMAANLGMNFLIMFCVQCLSPNFVIIKKSHYVFISAIIQFIIVFLVFRIAKWFQMGLMQTVFTYACVNVLLKTVIESMYFFFIGLSLKKYYIFVAVYILLPTLFCLGIRLFFF